MPECCFDSQGKFYALEDDRHQGIKFANHFLFRPKVGSLSEFYDKADRLKLIPFQNQYNDHWFYNYYCKCPSNLWADEDRFDFNIKPPEQ